jgi:hypothetical protein
MEERIESRGMTRGGLIKAGAAAALVVGAGGAGRALAGGQETKLAVPVLGKPRGGAAYLRRETYLPYVGSDFRVLRPGASTLRVKLIEVKQLPSQGEAFSLLFSGRPQSGVAEGVYRIEHPSLGGFDLFAGLVGCGVKSLDFEAVINRIST